MIPGSVLELLDHRLSSQPTGRLRFASVPVEVEPLEFVRSGAGLYGRAAYVGRPGGEEIGGLGVAWRRDAGPGGDRLVELARALEEAGAPAEVRFLFGASFSGGGPRAAEWWGFGPAVLQLPALAVVRREGSTTLDVAVPPGRPHRRHIETLGALSGAGAAGLPPGGDHEVASATSPGRWRELVEEARAAIRAGYMEKVVLARRVTVSGESRIDALDLLSSLRSSHPSCTSFGWQEGAATFVGASPELLLSRRGREVRSRPLAGSAPRGEGEGPDHELGERLLTSGKELEEHRLVVDDLVRRLRPFTSELWTSPRPSLERLASVQHLATELSGLLDGSTHILDLLAVLHPTPAVGGTPRQPALEFIEKHEGLDRGWYAGVLGWCEPTGDGEAVVAIRCALVRTSRVDLYAGAGIVGGSDPDAELAETRLKLRPLLDLVTAP